MEEKAEFRNRTDGFIGVVVINEKGDRHGASVGPGDRVWLSEQEQILTASAPKLDKDNPFVGGHEDGGAALELVTEKRPVRSPRPIGTPAPEGAPETSEEVEAAEEPAPEDVEATRAAKAAAKDEQDKADAEAEAKAKAEKAKKRAARSRRQSRETGAAAEPKGDPPTGEFAPGEEVGDPEAPKATG